MSDLSSREFGRDFIYVAALPKSASSLMWLIISTLQEEDGRANPGRMPNTFPSPYQSLQFDLMNLFPRGGVLSGHAPLSFDTNLFLRGTLCRYVIHLRHPADFIIGLYAHGMDGRLGRFIPPHLVSRLNFGDSESERWVYSLSAIDMSVFDRDKTLLDDAITQLLRDGLLFKALAWMCDWLAYRDMTRSIVGTYESLVTDFDNAVDRLCLFVRGQSIDKYRLDYLKYVFDFTAARGRSEESEKYPRGWTGEVGVWQSYFNSNHIDLYNETVNRFIECYPQATALFEPYPETLFLKRG